MTMIAHPTTASYFNGIRTATIDVRDATEVTVEKSSNPTDWTTLTTLAAIVKIKGIKEVTLVGGLRVPITELADAQAAIRARQVGLRLRGHNATDNTIQFEVDSQNQDLNASNENLQYRGLRLVLKDMRFGPWLGAINDYNNATAYVIGNRVFYNLLAYRCIANSTGNLPTNVSFWTPHTFASGERISYVRGSNTWGFTAISDATEVPLPPDYSAGTTYALGAKVFFADTAYKSLQNTNLNNPPSSSPTWWVAYYSENWTIRQFIGELNYGTSKQTYVFTYTLVNNFGEEGPPADPVTIDADYGHQITLHGYINSTVNTYQDYYKGAAGYRIRYYGFVADSSGTGEYKLIRESDPLGTSSFAGAFGHLIINRPADWQESLNTTLYGLPPATPLAIAAGENGMLHVLTDDYLATCEPFKGWAWPADYRKALTNRGIGMVSAPSGVLITTNGKPRYGAGPIPEQITLNELMIQQAGISQKALCSMGERGIAYASNDGIVIVQGLGATLASGTLFTRREWQSRYGTLLTKMRLAYHDERLVCIFPGTDQSESSNYQGFMVRFEEGAPMYTRLAINGSGLAVDNLGDQLLVGNLTGFYKFEAGYGMPLTWQSKLFITAKPENMGAAMCEYTGGPISLDVQADGVTVYTKTLPYAAGRVQVRWKLPAGYKSQNWSVYVTEGIPLSWSAVTTYASGATVTHTGVPWLSLQNANLNNTPALGSSWWSRIGGETVHRILLANTMQELAKA